MLTKVIGVLAALVLGSQDSSVRFSEMRVGDLNQACEAADIQNRTACQYYILGIVEGMTAAQSETERVCVPSGTSGAALEQTITAEMERDLGVCPKDCALIAANFVAKVALRSFPCSNPK